MRKDCSVLGVNFSNLTLLQLIDCVDGSISENKKIVLAFSNPEFLVEANNNSFLKNYLNNIVDINVADGIGVVLASRILGVGLKERVTGTDFVPELYKLCIKKRHRIFFLGGKPGVAAKAKEYLSKIHGADVVAGFSDGYFDDADNNILIESINNSGAQILMVCLGNPRQEKWISDNLSKIKVMVVFGNGGALDFWSGSVSRAPRIVQSIGFEWLYRLFQDFTIRRIRRQLKLFSFVFLCIFSRHDVNK